MEDHENAGDLHADQEMYDEQEIAPREAPKKKKRTQAVQDPGAGQDKEGWEAASRGEGAKELSP